MAVVSVGARQLGAGIYLAVALAVVPSWWPSPKRLAAAFAALEAGNAGAETAADVRALATTTDVDVLHGHGLDRARLLLAGLDRLGRGGLHDHVLSGLHFA